ncbi:hypothetical protein BO83DRAFT_14027 [Aspergillus eucalypticola CBS 122712]|uniref:Uncharacterized protein n=1 Tax=Aspergillus eucalypticola (strain CBS 122712 / IBT 29274) TaxID=1448314 RepID=A0A317VPG3_ASPEC|nr:uncharacterized protein BO83DRAFT_14027 [Aspergillus eucalypticola CBS 122712]PWY74732.1 hypothetical protein BO83DRAFT_14027 [Aspergillus eucalypticola CBS 122712]
MFSCIMVSELWGIMSDDMAVWSFIRFAMNLLLRSRSMTRLGWCCESSWDILRLVLFSSVVLCCCIYYVLCWSIVYWLTGHYPSSIAVNRF